MGAIAVIVISLAFLGLAISYTTSNPEGNDGAVIETHATGSNFTQEAHVEWANGSTFLLIPGGSMGNGVDIGDVNNDGKDEVVTVSQDMDASLLSITYQGSLRIWSYNGSSFNQLSEKVWKTDGKGDAGDTVVKIFTYGGSAYIITAGKDSYHNGPGLGSMRIWSYSNGISLVSNVSWRDEPGKNTTISDLYVGDVDGDGNTEIVTVGDIKWSTDNNTKNYSKAEIAVWSIGAGMQLSLEDKYIWSDPENDTYAMGVTAYDFDNDGLSEIIVGGSYGFNDSGVLRSKAQISIFHFSSSISLVKDVKWIDNDNCGVMAVAVDDVNGDGNEEIVAAGANKYYVTAGEVSIWDSNLNEIARAQFYIDPEGQPSGTHWDCLGLDLALGDFDSDGVKDIVVTGLSKGPHTGGDTFWNYLISFNLRSSLQQVAKVSWRTYDGEMSNSIIAGDVDGDGTTELFLFGYGWKTDSNGANTYYAMLYAYTYQQNVPEFNPELLIFLLPVAFLLGRRR